MPKLSRAQREAREARRATITSKTDQSSPSSTAIQTSPSALLTNQPVQTNTSSKKSSSSKQNSAAGAGGSNTSNKNGKEFRKSSSHTRSPSTTMERIPSMQQLPGSRIRNTDYFPQQTGSPPGFAASDVSTSEESQDETMNAGEISTSKANISLMDEHADGDEDELMGEPASVGGEDNPEVKCMWEDCGEVFNSLIDFINHLHDEHVGIHRARYSCEWSGCPRKGKAQTSRFALLSHLRSHTGEKPFTCPRPECDKSFTRSDALAKHMRVQHNINPVTSRGKSSTSATATAQLGMYGRQHGGKNRGETSGLGGEEEDWLEEGTGRGKSADVLGEELLELAEGEANGSLADVEHSLMMHGSKSPFFTYDNLFGTGSRALANLNGGSSKSIAIQQTSTKEVSIPDEELGIIRDHEYSIGISANDETRDEEAITRSEEMITKVLEQGRREWIRRERESAELRPDPEPILSKRDQIDYLSDEDPDDSKTYKRARRSSTRNAQMKAQGISDVVNLKRLYIIEKAKLRFIQQENKRMKMYLEDLRQIEKDELRQKRILLEQALEAELGKDVGAIFSPPASPQSQRR